MMGMDLGELLHSAVRGLHAGKNSEQAAGLTSPDHLSLRKPTKALYLAFDLRAGYYPGSEDRKGLKRGDAACSLHYLFHRTYGSMGFCATYTFASVHESPFARLDEIESWEFLSSHDSCWRDAARDKAWAVERELYERVYAQVGFKEEDHVPHNRLNWHVWFRDNSEPTDFYRWVDVQIDDDPADRHSYNQLIKIL